MKLGSFKLTEDTGNRNHEVDHGILYTKCLCFEYKPFPVAHLEHSTPCSEAHCFAGLNFVVHCVAHALVIHVHVLRSKQCVYVHTAPHLPAQNGQGLQLRQNFTIIVTTSASYIAVLSKLYNVCSWKPA